MAQPAYENSFSFNIGTLLTAIGLAVEDIRGLLTRTEERLDYLERTATECKQRIEDGRAARAAAREGSDGED